MLCVNAAYAVVRFLAGWVAECLFVTFVYCVETAKDTAIVVIEYYTNRKLYPSFRMVLFSMTLNDR